MKWFLVIPLVALCYAVPLTPTAPGVSFEKDGTITITGADGKRVVISKSIGNDGQKNVEISIPDPLGATKTITVNQDYNVRTVNIDDPTAEFQNDVEGARYKRSSVSKSSKETKKGKSEAEILDQIFEEYKGAVDLKSYEKVLKEIDSYIKSGDLDSSFIEVLKGLAQYEALNPEGTYLGQNRIGSEPGVGYSRLAYLQNYLNRAIGEQQGSNNAWFGIREPVTELYQRPIYSGVNPFWYEGVNGDSLQQYRDFYGQQLKNQLIPVQDVQQYLQQKWQPLYEPYQQQIPQTLQQLAQPQQQWNKLQSFWNLPKQQWIQGQEKLMWNPVQRQQQLTELQQLTQPQLLRSQQVLEQTREPLNSFGQGLILPERQLTQKIPLNLAREQQMYNPQQQYYGTQEQYYGPQEQYYVPQQRSIESQGKLLENLLYPQQQILDEQRWALSQQQLPQKQLLAQEEQRLPFGSGQQIQSNVPLGNYWQRL